MPFGYLRNDSVSTTNHKAIIYSRLSWFRQESRYGVQAMLA
jgi:hypothetical protein